MTDKREEQGSGDWGRATTNDGQTSRGRHAGRIGSIAGIDIYVHWTFGLLITWIFVTYWMQGAGAGGALTGTLLIATIFVCVFLHELGHAFAARHYGIRTRDITIYPIGGVARIERMPERPIEEMWVALAGPAVNLAIAVVLVGMMLGTQELARVTELPMIGGSFLASLAQINIVLAVFNLLPAFPMDGGRVLRALLATRLSRARATRIAAATGQGMAILFGIVGLFGNWMLLFIALFVWVGASQEAHAAQARAILGGVTVHDAMITRFVGVQAKRPLAEVTGELFVSGQKVFPVLEGSRPVGILSKSDILHALTAGTAERPIAEVMTPCRGVEDTAMLDETLARIREAGCDAVPVTRQGQLVGLISHEHVAEWLLTHAAYRPRPHRSLARRDAAG